MKDCGNCKYFAQGATHSYCENPKQNDKDRVKYCYYTHGCELQEIGISQTRIDYIANKTK
jgi:hypothetical protein